MARRILADANLEHHATWNAPQQGTPSNTTKKGCFRFKAHVSFSLEHECLAVPLRPKR